MGLFLVLLVALFVAAWAVWLVYEIRMSQDVTRRRHDDDGADVELIGDGLVIAQDAGNHHSGGHHGGGFDGGGFHGGGGHGG